MISSLNWAIQILAILAGFSATCVWIMFGRKVTDPKIKAAIFCCALTILMFSLSEVMFVKQSPIIREATFLSFEVTNELDLFGHLRYVFLVLGYLMLVLAAKVELWASKTYTFRKGFKFKSQGTKAVEGGKAVDENPQAVSA